MKILHVNTYDSFGGAARAAYRLHAGLRSIGQDSWMFVRHRETLDPRVLAFTPPADLGNRLLRAARRKSIAQAMRRYAAARPQDCELFSDDRTEHGASPLNQLPPCDVIHLHWVAGLVDYRSFFRVAPQRTPVVWTLHDMNPFTGGCHYDRGCEKYRDGCGACPQLGSTKPTDLSSAIWQRKHQAYQGITPDCLSVIAPSRWLAEEARRSALMRNFPVSVIPYGLDISAFAPRDRAFSRNVLGVPQDARVILFVAHWVGEQRKGFHLMARALAALGDVPNLALLSLGRGAVQDDIGVPHIVLGQIDNERLLSLVYSAADVYVIPTLQDNLPNTVLESLACGTPVIGFDVGGLPDVVHQGITGLLAPAGDTAALRSAIAMLLQKGEMRAKMAANCRRVAVEQYAAEVAARRYVTLYEAMLAKN